jgi:hypothetical protein
VPEVLRVSCPDLDQIAVIACNMMHFKHFGAVSKGSGNVLIGRGLVATDRDEREESEAESFRVDLGAVAADHTSSFELANPLENRRRCQPHRTGDVDLCFAGIRLELIQDLEVDGIEGSF